MALILTFALTLAAVLLASLADVGNNANEFVGTPSDHAACRAYEALVSNWQSARQISPKIIQTFFTDTSDATSPILRHDATVMTKDSLTDDTKQFSQAMDSVDTFCRDSGTTP